jgi:hypothetical protein
MKIINTSLLKPRDFIVIGLIAVLTHMVAAPLYKMIDGKGAAS